MSFNSNHLREFDKFRIDLKKKILWFENEPVQLPAKAVELLCVLVENPGEIVTKDEILDRVWQNSFVEESVLTQNVHHLRKALKDLVPNGNLIQTIPRRGYRFTGEVRQIPCESNVVVEREIVERSLLAEISEDSLKNLDWQNEIQLPLANRASYKSRFISASVLIFLILLSAGFFIWWLNQSNRKAAFEDIKSMAVLPLKSFATDAENESLRLRITDALITKLGNLNQLTVRPTNSVLRFAGENQDVVEAGKALQVDAVLDGRVQVENSRLRVTLQLVSVKNGEQLWSEQFDGKADEILALQDLISNRLQKKFAFEEGDRFKHLPTESSQAYEAYLKGRYLWNQRTAESYWKALEFFRQSVEIDPNFAPGYTGIADCYYLLNQRNALPAEEAFQKAESAAQRALEIDPALAEAHVSLGTVSALYHRRWDEAIAYFKRAIELNPQYAEAHARLGLHLTTMGNFDEGLAALKEAERLDPTSLNTAIYLGVNFYFSRQYERAIAQFQRALEFAPNVPAAYFHLTRIYERNGRFDEAVEAELKDRTITQPNWVEPFRTAYQTGGIAAFWKKQIELLKEHSERNLEFEYHIATRYALLNDAEKALYYLEKNQNNRGGMWHAIGVDPAFDSLRSNPRFVLLVEKLNMPG